MTGFCTNYGPWNRGYGPQRGFPRQTPPHLSRLISKFDDLAGASWNELERAGTSWANSPKPRGVWQALSPKMACHALCSLPAVLFAMPLLPSNLDECEGGCQRNGYCRCIGGRCELGQCICIQGWSGQQCEVHDCPADCSGHGRCSTLSPHVCMCDRGWKSLSCDEQTCPHSCSKRGTCDQGACLCERGFAGIACELTLQPVETDSDEERCSGLYIPACSGHGACTGRLCVCAEGWKGPACAEATCPNECGAHGQCMDGSCACDVGWRGTKCSIDECVTREGCSAHGICLRGASASPQHTSLHPHALLPRKCACYACCFSSAAACMPLFRRSKVPPLPSELPVNASAQGRASVTVDGEAKSAKTPPAQMTAAPTVTALMDPACAILAGSAAVATSPSCLVHMHARAMAVVRLESVSARLGGCLQTAR